MLAHKASIGAGGLADEQLAAVAPEIFQALLTVVTTAAAENTPQAKARLALLHWFTSVVYEALNDAPGPALN